MDEKELRREVEHAELLASQLSAQMKLFDGYYDNDFGLDQARIDPDCFFTAWNMLFDKTDEIYKHLKKLTKRLYEKSERNEGTEHA